MSVDESAQAADVKTESSELPQLERVEGESEPTSQEPKQEPGFEPEPKSESEPEHEAEQEPEQQPEQPAEQAETQAVKSEPTHGDEEPTDASARMQLDSDAPPYTPSSAPAQQSRNEPVLTAAEPRLGLGVPNQDRPLTEEEAIERQIPEYEAYEQEREGREEHVSAYVFVDSLPNTASEERVRDWLEEHGEIKFMRLVDRSEQGKSNFAFVRFDTPVQAAAAVRFKHEALLDGVQVRVLPKEDVMKNPRSTRLHQRNLYLSGLPTNITEKQLRTLFGRFGTLEKVKIVNVRTQHPQRGVAFLHFARPQEAAHCIMDCTGKELEGFPGCMPTIKFADVREGAFQQQMRQYGMGGPHGGPRGGGSHGGPRGHYRGDGGPPRGGGFRRAPMAPVPPMAAPMSYAPAPMMEVPMAPVPPMHPGGPGHGYYGAYPSARSGRYDQRPYGGGGGGEREESCNIYVARFPNDWKEEDLRAAFQHYGKIVSVRVLTKANQPPNRGMGFVHFEKPAEAQAAIAQTDKTMPFDAKEPLRVSVAARRGGRRGFREYGRHSGGHRGGFRGGYDRNDRGSRDGYRGGDRGGYERRERRSRSPRQQRPRSYQVP
ncbi:MAG: hypothetical protein MHM6MM_003473 [Cercozoa sp. M6MM]